MTTVPYPPQRQLSVAEVLDLSFRIYRLTAVKCLLFAALFVLAGQLPNIYAVLKGHPLASGQDSWQTLLAQFLDPTMIALYFVGLVLEIIFYAALLLRQRAMLTGGSIGGEVAAALGRLPALIAVAVLIVAAFAACFLPAFATSGVLRALLVLAALIAVSYAFVAVSCAQTILLVDGAGPVTSLRRSWRLTSGSFWRLSLIYTVAVIILGVLYGVIAAIAGFLAAVLGRGDVAMATAFTEVVAVALGALATPFYGALALAVLADLKVRKEGADLEQRISATA
jgi:hypothetical protein